MFKIFKKKDYYDDNKSIRPWVINQYTSLKNQGFTEEEISDCVILNDAERKEMNNMYELKDSVENLIDKMVGTFDLKEETIKESIKEDEVVDAEPVKDKEVKENDKVIDAEIVEEPVVEEDPSKWTDDEIIEKAITLLTQNITESQDKEQMSNLLRESFNTEDGLIKLYRTKFSSEYKADKNNLSDNKSTENTEKEDKKEVIESKEENVINEDKDDDNKINDLNIDNEMFEMLVDDVYDQYKMIFNIKKDKLKDLIIKVLEEKPEILKSTNYYFVCMRLCEIIENLIMENTIEDNEEDELLNQLNSLVE